ncbi:phage tail tape measure protein [Rhodopseudomonas sp. NSM]|uniref:phage tail tape measure protein n=1 Tax=Rhodopseudomonas sp. NSM TaxID=3457630 RepID=UPI004036A04B
MGTLTSKLILELIDRLTGPAKKANAALTALTAAQARNSAMLAATSQKLFVATAAAYGLAKGIGAPIKAAMDFESAMADVKKVVDFDTPDGLAKLSGLILEMSKRIPIAATGLAQISAAAGSAGMKETEIPAFTEMVAKLATAFDMTAEAAGEAMAKIKTGLGYTVPQTSALADAMNLLSNSMAAKAPAIIDFMKRVGVAGKQYGFSATQTAALGAAMIAAGAESEVAATSFRNIGKALTKADNVSKDTAAAFKQLGLTSMGVTKAMQKDAVGTFRNVLARIAKLPKHLQASVLSQIFGDEARAIAPLVDNVKLLEEAIGLVSSETKYLGSAEKEFQARTETTANAVQLFKNRLNVLSVTIGSALLPAVNDAMKAMHPFVERMTKWAKENPATTRALVGTAAALIGLRVAGLAAKLALGWMWGGVLATAAIGLKGLSAAIWLAQVALFPFGAALRAARTALIGFAAAAAIVGSGGALKIAAAALLALLGPIGLVAAAVGAAGVAIYAYWDEIKGALGKVNDALTGLTGINLFEAGKSILSSLWEGMKSVFSTMLGWVKAIPGAIKSAIGMGGGAAAGDASSGAAGGAPAVAGARAAGGPVQRGSTYLVGERGPELWRAPASGRIENSVDTVRAIKAQAIAGAAGRGGGGNTISNSVTISVQAAPGQSVEAIAEAVERKFSAKLAQLSRGAYSDGVN